MRGHVYENEYTDNRQPAVRDNYTFFTHIKIRTSKNKYIDEYTVFELSNYLTLRIDRIYFL